MKLKIKPDLTTFAGGSIIVGVIVFLIASYSLVQAFNSGNLFVSNNSLFDLCALIVGIILILGAVYGTYIILKENEIFRSEDFWPTHYPYDKIKKIYYMKHWYLGKIFVINYITRFGNEKTSRLLALSLYKPDDLKAMLNSIHKDHPLIELDDYCLGLINK